MVRCDPKARYDIMVAKRTVSNFLQMDYNTTYATAKQATTKWILFYKRIKECSQRTFAISDDDTIEFIVSHDAQLNDMLRIYEALKTRELHQYSTPISAAYYLIKEFNESDDKVMSFFNQIITGANITDGSPVQALRRNLTDKLTRQKVVTNRADAEITFAITITAWNCYFHNKRIKLLKFQDNYDFPTINALPPRRKTGQLDTSCANEDE